MYMHACTHTLAAYLQSMITHAWLIIVSSSAMTDPSYPIMWTLIKSYYLSVITAAMHSTLRSGLMDL